MSSFDIFAAHSLRECVDHVAQGKITSQQMVESCFAAIDATDADLQAWESLDREQALARAKELDDFRRRGRTLGKLHGVPIGIKDNIDTADLPTRYGSEIYAAHQPEYNAAVVDKLLEAGAIILGKTVSTEFAYMHPSRTRNPHNFTYSPGGSSSGSAAAVAAGQVPVSLGSQTNGSVIRPASFCGCFGLKPSSGVFPRRGVFKTSDTLDQVGLFARNPDDIALVSDALKGFDNTDSHSKALPRPGFMQGYLSDVPVPPDFAWIDLPYADQYSDSMREGMHELLQELNARVDRIPAPVSFSALLKCHKIIYDYEIYRCLAKEREQDWDKMSSTAQAAMEKAKVVSSDEYSEALDIRDAACNWFVEFFNDYDAIIAPSALGEPPLFGDGTGNPVCSTIWTLCGLPCLSMPLLQGVDDMPLGVQLIGAHNEDDRLMRTTRWLLDFLNK